MSNMSTPTLLSDTSSVRSCSMSSSPRTPPNGNSAFKKLAASTPDLHLQPKTRAASLGRQNSLIDTTSMASLTIRSQGRGRTRKQREQDLDLDNDDDIWPQDEVMFNVPMSPALYAQQKQKLLLHRQNSVRRMPYDFSNSLPTNMHMDFHPHEGMQRRRMPHNMHHIDPQNPQNPQNSQNQPKHQMSNSSSTATLAEKSLQDSDNGESNNLDEQNDENQDIEAPDGQRKPVVKDVGPLGPVGPMGPMGMRRVGSMGPVGPMGPMGPMRPNMMPISANIGADALHLTMDLCRHEEEKRNSVSSASNTSRNFKNGSQLSLAGTDEEANTDSSLESSISNNTSNSTPVSSMDPLEPPKPLSNDSRRSSLTRPENLPPKSAEEERKHLKKYEKMLRDSAAAEKRKTQKREHEQKKKSLQAAADLEVWKQWITKMVHQNATNTASKRKSASKNDAKKPLVKISDSVKYRGIPPSLRPQVWMLLTGVSRSQSKLKPETELPEGNDSHREEIIAKSELIWPECNIFGQGRPLHDALIRATQRMLTEFPDVQHIDSLVSLSALLLLYLDENDSVAVMTKLLRPGSLPHAVLTGHEKLASAYYGSFHSAFETQFPHLYNHFQKNNVSDSEILNPFMPSLLADILPTPELAARIIDMYLFDSDQFLLHASLGVLRINEAWLYVSKPEILDQLKHPREVDEDTFLDVILETNK